ncbi:hypothetical protein JCM16303_004385 [Sporobolomyces ruberrimus]
MPMGPIPVLTPEFNQEWFDFQNVSVGDAPSPAKCINHLSPKYKDLMLKARWNNHTGMELKHQCWVKKEGLELCNHACTSLNCQLAQRAAATMAETGVHEVRSMVAKITKKQLALRLITKIGKDHGHSDNPQLHNDDVMTIHRAVQVAQDNIDQYSDKIL